MGIFITCYLTNYHIYVPGTKNNFHTQFYFISIVYWKFEKYGSEDIIIIGIASINRVHDRKAHIPLFLFIWYLFFFAYVPFNFTSLFNRPEKLISFTGWLVLLGQRCILILKELVVNFALVFDPVSQLFDFPAFHVRSFSMIMVELTIS